MKMYVAYGSNLNLEQMAVRCPGARIVGTGMVHDYVLKYRGSKTGAYATILRKRGSKVPVLVWRVTKEDEMRLDRYEGFPRFYYKRNIKVVLDNGRKLFAMAYIMNDEAKPGIPSNYYISTLLTGYQENKLDVNHLFDSLYDNKMEVK